MKFMEEISRFPAKSDKGDLYLVIHFKEYNKILTSDNKITQTEDIFKWKTSEGYPLKQINARTYQLILTNEILHRT
jgi:hypothetical protein